MSQKSLVAAVFVGLALGVTARASEVAVQGATKVVNQHGAGISIKYSQFAVTYQNDQLPWGSQVELHYGLRCTIGGSWSNKGYPQPLVAASPFTWQTQLENVVTGEKYKGHCGDFEFVFRVTLPDGSQFYDNGGRAQMGFYSASVPYHPSGNLEQMTVRALGSAAEY